MITGFFAPANRLASSSMPFASAVAPGAEPRSPGTSLIILSNRYSIGKETKAGPLGAAIASWQARWMVAGKIGFVVDAETPFHR